LLCYLIDAIGIERDVPFDLLYRRGGSWYDHAALTDFFPPAGML
jgi:hypothetical protein